MTLWRAGLVWDRRGVDLGHLLVQRQVVHQVAVTKHHPLRVARRPGGVLQKCEIARAGTWVTPGLRGLLLHQRLGVEPFEALQRTGLSSPGFRRSDAAR